MIRTRFQNLKRQNNQIILHLLLNNDRILYYL